MVLSLCTVLAFLGVVLLQALAVVGEKVVEFHGGGQPGVRASFGGRGLCSATGRVAYLCQAPSYFGLAMAGFLGYQRCFEHTWYILHILTCESSAADRMHFRPGLGVAWPFVRGFRFMYAYVFGISGGFGDASIFDPYIKAFHTVIRRGIRVFLGLGGVSSQQPLGTWRQCLASGGRPTVAVPAALRLRCLAPAGEWSPGHAAWRIPSAVGGLN